MTGIVAEWQELEKRAQAIHDSLAPKAKMAFNELVLVQIKLYHNLHQMYLHGKSFFVGERKRPWLIVRSGNIFDGGRPLLDIDEPARPARH